MIDTTERPTSSSKLAKGEARYNEFGCNIVRKNEVVAYTDRESFVLADVFGFLALDLVGNCKRLSVWRNKTGHCWRKSLLL